MMIHSSRTSAPKWAVEAIRNRSETVDSGASPIQRRIIILVNSQISSEFQDILRAEERNLLNTFPPVERRVAILDLVRSIDQFFLGRIPEVNRSHSARRSSPAFLFTAAIRPSNYF